MHSLSDIKQEILRQHRQLAFNRRELRARRAGLVRKFRQGLHSRGALLAAFAGGLLLGWWKQARPRQHDGSPPARGLKALGHWLIPVKGALWSGLIRTATGYTADRISGELREYGNQ